MNIARWKASRVRSARGVTGVASLASALCFAGCYHDRHQQTEDAATADSGIAASCGNGIVEAGEECELGARSAGTDGLASGTVYDEWTCDRRSCKRLYLFTPCESLDDCGEGAVTCGSFGQCVAVHCVYARWSDDPKRFECVFPGGRTGYCAADDNCIPFCETPADCPEEAPCVTFGKGIKLCDTTGVATPGPHTETR